MFYLPLAQLFTLTFLFFFFLFKLLLGGFAFGYLSSLTLCGIVFYHVLINLKKDKEIRWDWNNIQINAKDIAYRIYRRCPEFEFGTATAAHQVEGNNSNNWSEFEKQENRIKNGDKSGKACDQYNLYPKDIQLMKDQLKVHSYRFSVEWSRIEPKRGTFDKEAIKHYHNLIDELIKANITPVLTIHHFSNPIWFEQLGAFEKEENVDIFVGFGEFIFKEYSSKVKIFCTINEPNVYSFGGYLDGIFPPGRKDNRPLAFKVLKHMLQSHTTLYWKLKNLPNGPKCKIGIVHNLHQFDPLNTWNPIDHFLAYLMDYTFNESILKYFKTGRFYVNIPGLANEDYLNTKAVGGTDFYGINYYSHFNVTLNYKEFSTKLFSTVVKKEFENLTTEFKYPVYGEGIYRILQRASELKVPLYVTENGCPDSKDTLRDLYIKRYLYSLSKAMEEGVNLKGYMYWSFSDNFEWAEGFSQRFGLYEMNYETQERKLRNGSQFFIEVVKELKALQK